VKFEKWQALGNDYLILERANLPWELTEARIEWLCDPHFGIGADGILLLAPSDDPEFVAALRIFNPDGSEAELSGNGAREAVLYLRKAGWTEHDTFSILTKAGPIKPTLTSERTATVKMGRASTTSADYPGGDADGKATTQRGEGNFAGRGSGVLAEQMQRLVHDNGRVVAHIAQRTVLPLADGMHDVGASAGRIVAPVLGECHQPVAVDRTEITLHRGLLTICAHRLILRRLAPGDPAPYSGRRASRVPRRKRKPLNIFIS